jgi:pimeloyl-ACP methyl ester carboxylesterase
MMPAEPEVAMNKRMAVWMLLAAGAFTLHAQEVMRIASFDDALIEGRLHVPASGFRDKIVIDVPSSGPHTYENRRQIGRSLTINYHDFFRDELARRGVAYFSCSTRYTAPDAANPPNFDRVDRDKFYTYTPSQKVQDLEAVITSLKKDKRLATSRVLLLGFSEGAIIATLVAERKRVPVDAVFLAGAPTDDVYATMLWQFSGESSMVNFRKFFDGNKDGVIQREEYEKADPRAVARVGGRTFAELDVNNDAILSREDFRQILAPQWRQIVKAIENDDNEWLWNSFFRVGAPWLKEHRSLESNRARILRLDLPVFMFHGTADANCPVAGIAQLQKRALELNRRNIQVFIFPEHDHSLDFIGWVVTKTLPAGLQALFEQIEKF